MAINVSVQCNGGLLPDIILLTQCYYHRGTHLNAMKRFCICSLWSNLNVLTFFPLYWGMLRRSRCVLIFSLNNHYFFKKHLNAPRPSGQGGETVKAFRWDHRLQIQNLVMTFKRVPRW